MTKIWITAGVACALTLAGCGGGGTPAKSDAGTTPAASAGAATPDMDNGATITGKVTFDGTAPVMKVLDMSAVPACTAAHKTPAGVENVWNQLMSAGRMIGPAVLINRVGRGTVVCVP